MSSRLVADRTPGSHRSSVHTGRRWVAAQSSEPLRQPFGRQYDRLAAVAGATGTLIASVLHSLPRLLQSTPDLERRPSSHAGPRSLREWASLHRHRAVTVSAVAHRGGYCAGLCHGGGTAVTPELVDQAAQ